MPILPTEILFLCRNQVCGCYLCLLTDCMLFIKLFTFLFLGHICILLIVNTMSIALESYCASCALVKYYLSYFYFLTSYRSRTKLK